MRTGPTNPITRKLIEDFRSSGYKHKNKLFLSLAERLNISTRRRPNVNISKLQRVCKEKENIVIPGKLLSYGIIEKPVIVYALSFSKAAQEKITKAGGKVFGIGELLNAKIKGLRVIV